MKKEKYQLEYVFDTVTKQSLWRHVSAPVGLESWFADNVDVQGSQYIFNWGDTQIDKANVLDLTEGERIRFKWENDATNDSYFEFAIHNMELTGGKTLEITDFATDDEKTDAIELWDSLVERLRKSLGAG
ncbi:START-like domain-containing protein [Porphyromonas pogonae]|uniref:START-like domain-containing protein n=1 Tax=Porphyromonas pogonae TaxID=867595 RepID=UPI002E77FC6C|nr:START-like domain-containing protein [Porphyromonas pogonae]